MLEKTVSSESEKSGVRLALRAFVDSREQANREAPVNIICVLLIIAFALTIFLAGEPGTEAPETIVHNDSSTLPRIVFYGPEGGQTDLLGQPDIFVNGIACARLTRGTYFSTTVSPGPVAVCIYKPDHNCHTIQAVTGRVYYFRVTYPYPLGYTLSRVDAAKGESERLHNASSPIPQHLISDKRVESDLK